MDVMVRAPGFGVSPVTEERQSGRSSEYAGEIVILTGERGSGKTTAASALVDHGRRAGLDCAGLLSPARYRKGVRVGADVIDVRTGDRRPFAFEDPSFGARPVRKLIKGNGHHFDFEVAAWAAERLEKACPCHLLVVDEIGPLELSLGMGWPNALEILRRGEFGLAVVVVRQRLAQAVLALVEARPSSPPVLITPSELSNAVDLLRHQAIA